MGSDAAQPGGHTRHTGVPSKSTADLDICGIFIILKVRQKSGRTQPPEGAGLQGSLREDF
jgi:hypothetical protein